ncbi:ABC transporter permease [Streptomyces virginiae]|uniref:ABC transporter permease n=1 Tax=Streptomyces virginiae TaxID=1961 RepID=UPI00099D80FF|nr:ABC transporter permease subunit [Streptomyces virginiae]
MKSATERLLLPGMGALVILLVAELIGRSHALGPNWPPPSSVWIYATTLPTRMLLQRAARTTIAEAAGGLFIGTTAASVLAVVVAIFPPLRPGLERFATLLNSLPMLAVAPLLVITVGTSNTPVIIAAIAAGFSIFVALVAAVHSAPAVREDLFAVLGSSRLFRLRKMQIPSGIPLLIDGFLIAIPSAMLGAIIGEWFGATRGLGALLVTSMQNSNPDMLWAAALCTSTICLIPYSLLTIARRASVRRFSD